jgi:hypothetical protein
MPSPSEPQSKREQVRANTVFERSPVLIEASWRSPMVTKLASSLELVRDCGEDGDGGVFCLSPAMVLMLLRAIIDHEPRAQHIWRADPM